MQAAGTVATSAEVAAMEAAVMAAVDMAADTAATTVPATGLAAAFQYQCPSLVAGKPTARRSMT
jgi:hypothetical protein